MGLAERFKDKLEQRNIFEQKNTTSPINPQKPAAVNKEAAAEQPEKEKSSEIIDPIENILEQELKENSGRYEFEDMETKIIAKIRKTPYWSEYSIQRQEKMISSYLDKKRFAGREITPFQLQELVKNIIILSNH